MLNAAPVLMAASTPVAIVGPDDQTVLVGQMAELTGERSYYDAGNITSYVWDLGDGARGVGMTVSHAYSAPGRYTVTLIVMAEDGATGTDTGTVTVVDNREGWTVWIESASTPKATYSPGETIEATVTVERGPDALTAVWEGDLVLAVLDGTGTTVHYDDLPVELTRGGAQETLQFEFALDGAGDYVLRLSLYRFNDTMVDRRELNVTVAGDQLNKEPLAFIDPASQVVEVGAAAAFDGSRSYDPDGNVTAHVWDFGDGVSSEGPTATHAYRVAGTYNVTLTVTDEQGAIGSAWALVEVVARGPDPGDARVWISTLATDKGAYEVGEAMDVTVVVTRGPDLLTWVWEGTLALELLDIDRVRLGSWERAIYLAGGGATQTVTLSVDMAKAGPHLLVATLYWWDGAFVDRRQVNVSVNQQHQNQPPTAVVDPEEQTIGLGDAARLDGSRSFDVDGRVAFYAWDLGDGTLVEGPTASHTYRVLGVYNVTLTVADDDGAVSLAYAVVDVRAVAPHPGDSEAWIVSVATDGTAGMNETIAVTVTVERGGDLLDYVWLGTLALDVVDVGTVPTLTERVELPTGGETRTIIFEFVLDEPGDYLLRLTLYGQDGSPVDIEEVAVTVSEVVPDPGRPHPPDENLSDLTNAAVAAAGILVVLGALGATEAGKVSLLGLLLPLYTKLRKEDVLDQFTRGKIYGYILANPGDHYNSIQRTLDIPNGTFSYHLYVLEKEGYIKSAREGTRKCFFPAGMRIPFQEGGTLRAGQRLIIEKILEKPGISQRDIASSLGVSPSTVNYHLKGLLDLGVVESERKGMRLKYYINRELHPSPG